MLCRALDAVESEYWPPQRDLILPSWFPDSQLEFANQWALQHGWTGVRRGG